MLFCNASPAHLLHIYTTGNHLWYKYQQTIKGYNSLSVKMTVVTSMFVCYQHKVSKKCKIPAINEHLHIVSNILIDNSVSVFYSGIKTCNHLPKTTKELSHDVKQFSLALKRFNISNSFYSLEEYFDINWK
jgi:hypothetical protein